MMSGMPLMNEQGFQYMPYDGGFGGANYFMPYGPGVDGFAASSGMGYGSGGWQGSPDSAASVMEALAGGSGRPGRGSERGGKGRAGGGYGPCAGGMEEFGVEASYE